MKIIGWTLALLAMTMINPLTQTARADERAQVPEKYKWNTADLYPSEAAWSQAKDDIASRIPKLVAFQGRLGASADISSMQIASAVRDEPRATQIALLTMAAEYLSSKRTS